MKGLWFAILVISVISLSSVVARSASPASQATPLAKSPKHTPALVRQAQAASDEVEALCRAKANGNDELRRQLVDDVFPKALHRDALIRLLRNGGGSVCRDVLIGYLRETGEGKAPADKGHFSLLILGVSANLPGLASALSQEVVSNRGAELLDTLRSTDRDSYVGALRAWAGEAAGQVRNQLELMQLSATLYGKTSLTDADAKRSPVRVTAPLLLEQFIAILGEKDRKIEDADFANANVLLGSATTSYKDLFFTSFANTIKKSERQWLASFRLEPPWIQTRLVPIMESLGGPEMVRELMWLSTYHADLRIRTLAGSALDNILAAAGKQVDGAPKKQ